MPSHRRRACHLGRWICGFYFFARRADDAELDLLNGNRRLLVVNQDVDRGLLHGPR